LGDSGAILPLTFKSGNSILMKSELMDTLSEHDRLGIAQQFDYSKFSLYSLITQSTAIEGSTVTEAENQLFFDEGIPPKKRNLSEVLMNLDLHNAYQLSIRFAKHHRDYSLGLLREISAVVLKNTGCSYNTALGTFDSSKGDLRKVNVSASASGKSYINHSKGEGRLKKWCSSVNEKRKELLKSEEVYGKYLFTFDSHLDLLTIHPWVDGNGRTARLVMNQLQFELGLVPAKILKEDKADYIDALIKAREHHDPSIFSSFMMALHIRNLQAEIREFKKSQEVTDDEMFFS
jgi:fido (protein-threonine AMPylation protein)